MAYTKPLLALCALALLIGAGCAASPSTTTPPASLTGSWTLVGVSHNGQAVDLGELNATLMLTEDTLSGMICNTMSGAYALDAGHLRADALAVTKKYCVGTPGEVEQEFLNALKDGLSLQVSAEVLILSDDAGTVFTYSRDTQP